MPKIVKPRAEIIRATRGMEGLIEEAARLCYQSAPKDEPQDAFLRRVIDMGHLSVAEHAVITVRFTVNRGVTHELVRHRLASFSQESTRYCNYSKDRFDEKITVINPERLNFNEAEIPKDVVAFNGVTRRMNKFYIWFEAMKHAEWAYLSLLNMGATPQEARDVLPNGLKADIMVTANVREWRQVIFAQRTAPAAHPQMREVMIPLEAEFIRRWPVLFDTKRE